MNRMIALFEEDIIDQISFDEIASEGYDDVIDTINDRVIEKKEGLFENSETVTDAYESMEDSEMEEEFEDDDLIDYVDTDTTEG